VRKLLLPLLAAAALAAPVAAMAHGSWFGRHHALLARLSGTGTSFAGASATASGTAVGDPNVGTGTFAATITNDTAHAVTRTGDRGTLTCAPATATLTVTGATTTNAAKATLTGRTCTWTPTSGSAIGAFFGRGSATGAGTLASLTGQTEKAFIVRKADGTVHGAVFAGTAQRMFAEEFAVREHDAASETGHCDHR
jgi:hypothetical protein